MEGNTIQFIVLSTFLTFLIGSVFKKESLFDNSIPEPRQWRKMERVLQAEEVVEIKVLWHESVQATVQSPYTVKLYETRCRDGCGWRGGRQRVPGALRQPVCLRVRILFRGGTVAFDSGK